MPEYTVRAEWTDGAKSCLRRVTSLDMTGPFIAIKCQDGAVYYYNPDKIDAIWAVEDK